MPLPIPLTPLPGWRGGDGNAAYLDKTLRHGPVEIYFDESVGWHSVKALWFRSALCSVMFMIVTVFVLPLAVVGGIAVFFLVFLLSRQAEPIGEWRTVLADRARACPSVYSAIMGNLAERKMPIESVQARRHYNSSGTVDNRLVLVDGHYKVYVSVFEYGTSLYLGWMMYRSRRGSTLVARFVTDLFVSMTRGQDVIDLMLRTERPRALREVAHASCREGLHVAIERIEVPAGYGFPEGLPEVEPLPSMRGPAPGLAFPSGPAAPAPGRSAHRAAR
jgi:hypothetical protein